MKRYLSILICAAVCSAAAAEDADQLFNPAAKEYIYGHLPVASNLVYEALNKFPNDENLQKLKKLIEEQQQKDQQKQEQDQKDQDKQDQDKKDQNKQDQQQKDQQKQDQQNQQDQDQSEQSDQTDQANQNKEEPQPAQPQQAGEMSPQEAQQLLDAMKQNEKDQRSSLRLYYLGQPIRVDKDW